MKNLLNKLTATASVVISLFLLSTQQLMAATCNPGDHWVDACVGGTDNLTSISGVFALDFIGLGVFVIPVSGDAAVISRSSAIDTPDPLDPGHNNQINMELVSATMTNIDPIPGAGDISVRVGISSGVSTATTGLIIEQSTPSLADSFFDIFFEVDSAIGTFHNVDPVRISAVINEWDADAGVFFEIDPTFGLPQVFNDAGLLVANTLFIDDVTGLTLGVATVPVPPAIYLFGTALFGLAGFARRKQARV